MGLIFLRKPTGAPAGMFSAQGSTTKMSAASTGNNLFISAGKGSGCHTGLFRSINECTHSTTTTTTTTSANVFISMPTSNTMFLFNASLIDTGYDVGGVASTNQYASYVTLKLPPGTALGATSGVVNAAISINYFASDPERNIINSPMTISGTYPVYVSGMTTTDSDPLYDSGDVDTQYIGGGWQNYTNPPMFLSSKLSTVYPYYYNKTVDGYPQTLVQYYSPELVSFFDAISYPLPNIYFDGAYSYAIGSGGAGGVELRLISSSDLGESWGDLQIFNNTTVSGFPLDDMSQARRPTVFSVNGGLLLLYSEYDVYTITHGRLIFWSPSTGFETLTDINVDYFTIHDLDINNSRTRICILTNVSGSVYTFKEFDFTSVPALVGTYNKSDSLYRSTNKRSLAYTYSGDIVYQSYFDYGQYVSIKIVYVKSSHADIVLPDGPYNYSEYYYINTISVAGGNIYLGGFVTSLGVGKHYILDSNNILTSYSSIPLLLPPDSYIKENVLGRWGIVNSKYYCTIYVDQVPFLTLTTNFSTEQVPTIGAYYIFSDLV